MKNKMDSRRVLRRKDARTARENLSDKWRKIFRGRRQLHDPMLVFNMSIFNSGSGWQKIFNPLKVRENVESLKTRLHET